LDYKRTQCLSSFPYVGQAFVIERCVEHKKNGKKTMELAYGVTSKTPDKANAKQVLAVIVTTGALEINAIIFLTKHLMKIAAKYEQAMVQKT